MIENTNGINMKKTITNVCLLGLLLSSPMAMTAEDYEVNSPDGKIAAVLHLEEGKLAYTVSKDGKTLVDRSPLGLTTNKGDFSAGGLEYVSHDVAALDETYTLTTGKQLECRNNCSQLTLTVKNVEKDWNLSVLFRLYDDGFAFRYEIPRKENLSRIQIKDEASRIKVKGLKYCLGSRFNHPDDYTRPNIPYESNYGTYTWSEMQGHGHDARLNAPALAITGSEFILISEAANVGTYSTALLRAESEVGEFSFAYSGDTKDMDTDKIHTLTVDLPLKTPWRMAIVGSLSDVFESVMTESLNEPNVLQDTGWIRPGWVSWDWGGVEGGSYGDSRVECNKKYIDLAVEMGWPYAMIDGGWNDSEIPAIKEYADTKGVELLLWQTARLSESWQFSFNNMENTLDQWKAWGIKGVKIDFWEDDSRTTMERMELLLKLCAERQMLVNFHGCTRPSGLRRTYPHLMTQEAIMGGEQNFWNNKHMTAEHHINLFFTRNVVGAADYTPGDMVDNNGTFINLTTVAHRMGLLVGFESGLQHMAESPEALRYFEGKEIMKRVPTVWDESRLLEGKVSQYATIARRNGEDWWIAGATVAARNCRMKLDFLSPGKEYTAYIYRDGSCRSDMTFERRVVDSGTTLSLREASCGGFLVQISPKSDLPSPVVPETYEAEASANTLSSGVTVNDVDATYASGGKQVGDLGVGRQLMFNDIKATHGKGQYVLSLYYVTAEDRKAELLVNGNSLGMQTFKSNRSRANTYGPKGMGVYRMVIELQEGDKNVITLKAPKDNWSPNFDRITLVPLVTGETSLPVIKNKDMQAATGPVFSLDGRLIAEDVTSFRGREDIYLIRCEDGSFIKRYIENQF